MNKINIVEVLIILWKKVWIIAIAFVVFAAAGFSYSAFYATEVWHTGSAILVTSGGIINVEDGKQEEEDTKKSKISNSEITTTFNMLETYAYSLRMLKFYDKVEKAIAGKTNLTYSAGTLRGMTSISYAETALLIKIDVSGGDTEDIKVIAQTIAELSPEHLDEIFPGTVAIVSEDATGVNMTYPNDTLFTMGGGLVGAVLAAVVIYIIAIRDNTVKCEEDIAELGYTVLGYVPDFNESKGGGYYSE